MEIINVNTDKVFTFPEFSTYGKEHRLPFDINLNNKGLKTKYADGNFIINFKPIKSVALGLKSKIKVEAIGELSDLLKLTIKGESKELSEKVLNTLMDVFDKDGIYDRQLISKRTLDFIDDRFVFLARELDSIEVDRQDFKQRNNLII